jgi:hypothetical protein
MASCRMKLAPYSMWAGESVVDEDDSWCSAELLSAHPRARDNLLTCAGSVYVTNALAVIDAAGLDKIRAAARELREHERSAVRDGDFLVRKHRLEDALFRALDKETESK